MLGYQKSEFVQNIPPVGFVDYKAAKMYQNTFSSHNALEKILNAWSEDGPSLGKDEKAQIIEFSVPLALSLKSDITIFLEEKKDEVVLKFLKDSIHEMDELEHVDITEPRNTNIKNKMPGLNLDRTIASINAKGGRVSYLKGPRGEGYLMSLPLSRPEYIKTFQQNFGEEKLSQYNFDELASKYSLDNQKMESFGKLFENTVKMIYDRSKNNSLSIAVDGENLKIVMRNDGNYEGADFSLKTDGYSYSLDETTTPGLVSNINKDSYDILNKLNLDKDNKGTLEVLKEGSLYTAKVVVPLENLK